MVVNDSRVCPEMTLCYVSFFFGYCIESLFVPVSRNVVAKDMIKDDGMNGY